jgi:hypothetical protein
LIDKLTQETVRVFDARRLSVDGEEKPCLLFFTKDTITVAVITRRIFWIAIPVAFGIIISIIGLFLKHLTLSLIGLSAGIGVTFLFGSVHFVIGRKNVSKLKELAPHQVLALTKENFAIPFQSIVRIVNKRFERYAGPGYLLPPLPSYGYAVEIVTPKETYMFLLDRKEFYLCNDFTCEALPDKVTEFPQD